jgi:type II secretory pathway predicted ATPase ExeA/LysM repeat protein
MFLDFYRLREQPFGVGPNPKYLYFSPSHREALASLFYGIETGRGFLALIAEPGMGKTSLLFQLLERLKGSIRSAFLFQTQCDSRELLRYLLQALGIDSQETDLVQLHSRLNQFLLAEATAGRRVVVFIDEAQNLSDSALETVRLLSNFEATDRKLFQIVLAGQPELARRLKNPHLAQLSQRIAVLTGLKPLPVSETLQYIHHRLEIAGYDGPEVFTSDSVELIAKASQGIPRNINNICFNAMSLACAMGCRRIGPEIVREALNDLSLDCLVEKSGILRRRTPTLGTSRQFSLGWLRDKVLTSRTVQTAVLSALLGSLATYLGAHTATGIAHSSPAASLDSESAAQRPATSAATNVDGYARAGRDSDASKFFTYVVQPDDTIWKLCQWSIGRYDETVVSELRKLNPQLSDVDRIEVGQQIRLPMRSPN